MTAIDGSRCLRYWFLINSNDTLLNMNDDDVDDWCYNRFPFIVVPSKPLNLTVLDVTANSITMSWLPPKNQNGAIAGYYVFHKHDNQTGVEIVKRNTADFIIRYEIPKLSKYGINSRIFLHCKILETVLQDQSISHHREAFGLLLYSIED